VENRTSRGRDKHMKLTSRRERSAPVYVDTGEGVVSLVYEVAVMEARPTRGATAGTFTSISPLAVHVIDDTGVQRLGFAAVSRPLIAIGTAFLLGPLLWATVGRRKQRE
jgi:hypothetical protein